MRFKKYRNELLLILAGCLLLPVPLLRDFHFELALIASLGGFLRAGFFPPKKESRLLASVRVVFEVFLLSLPSLLFSMFSGCLSVHGTAYWLLFVLPSVFLASALNKVLDDFGLSSRLRHGIMAFILVFAGTIIPFIELSLFPQVYLFNHIWGGWPGPIYDEEILVRPALMLFRSISLLWILLLWNLSEFNSHRAAKAIVLFSLFGLMFSYTQLDDWKIITPNETLEKRLNQRYITDHFELFFDGEAYSEDEARYYASLHEFYFDEIVKELEVDWPEGRKIHSYLYADAWQKKEWVGAKFTSYVPVWLELDQLHIAKQQLDDVLKHELVHVIAKLFGNDFFNASWSIGMTEGLATAVAGDSSPLSTLDQIVTAERPLPEKEELHRAFSFWGFYGSSAGISYTTTGSFVRYMLDTLPLEDIKTAYREASLDHFPITYDQMYEEWTARMNGTYVDSLDLQVSENIFGRLSLFQKDCPHSLSKSAEIFDRINLALTKKDTLTVAEEYDKLMTLQPDNPFVQTEWLRWKLNTGAYPTVIDFVSDEDSLLTHQIMKADALMLAGKAYEARQLLDRYADDFRSEEARQFRYTLEMRTDSLNWNQLVEGRYLKQLPDSSTFVSLSSANKILAINRALILEDDESLLLYLQLLPEDAFDEDWFESYLGALYRLAYLRETDLFSKTLEPMLQNRLRQRYSERMAEVVAYFNFMQQRPQL
jgi:hypothetical protein